jgi:CRP-like cAMP-binding protein
VADIAAEELRIMPLFEGFSLETLDPVAKQMSVRTHPANQAILLQNDWGNAVYFIIKGWVKIRTYDLEGREITLTILGPGEVVGEMAALDEVPRSTDVMTLTETIVSSLPAHHFIQFLKTEPQAGIQLARLMSRRLRQINRRLQLRESNSQARVADIIIFLAESRGRVSRAGIEVPNLPHRELSSLSGLARETVTRVLSKLEQDGIIQRSKESLCIPNLDALEKLIL